MMIKKIAILCIFFLATIVSGQEKSYTIEKLTINDDLSNFGSTFYGSDKVIFASPTKRNYIIRNKWRGNNQPYLDLFIGDISENGQLVNVREFSDKINKKYHEANVDFTKDHKTVYFSSNNYLNNKYKKNSNGVNLVQLYRAQIGEDGEWENIESMPFNSDEYQTGHPALSEDGKTLYFISDMPGGYGKTDIYKASIDQNGNIGDAVNLGPEVNTTEREMFPSIGGEDELYFSSDGRPEGLGALDIYVLNSKEGDVSILNIGAPINSERDDFSFLINEETGKGYFSSNRAGGSGDDDIYHFVRHIEVCKQIAQGVVINKKTRELIPGSLVILYNDKAEELNRMVVGDDARFSFEVECNNDIKYKVVGSKDKYSEDYKEFIAVKDQELELELGLPPIEEFVVRGGKCIIKINPIYFDFDKSYIRSDAELELNRVVEVMNKYPEIIIEGGSHTDSRGRAKYNEALSARRARSTVDYIIRRGVSSSRISSRGYGERQPVNHCSDGVKCSEAEHQFNRRTEFMIVNFDEIQAKYPDICKIKATSTRDQINRGIKINVDPKRK